MPGEDLAWRTHGDRRTAKVAGLLATVDATYTESRAAYTAAAALLDVTCTACGSTAGACVWKDQRALNAALGTILGNLGLPARRCCATCDHEASRAPCEQPATPTTRGADALAFIETRTTWPHTATGNTQRRTP